MSGQQMIAVAMSGGVDSSVAAALALEEGKEAVGLSMRLSSGPESDTIEGDAKEVCDALGMDHHVVDCEALFEAAVLRPCWEEYKSGRTPNPCCLCNPRVKIAALLDAAKSLGASQLATGHHARISGGPGGQPMVRRGLDARKDQSYFLAFLTEAQRAMVLFPVGVLTKGQVREKALALQLPSAHSQESQDVCPAARGPLDQSFAQSLAARFGDHAQGGPIVSTEGTVLGAHNGIHRFTIGQRKGLGVSLGQRAYVVDIEPKTRTVVVGARPEDLLCSSLEASAVSLHVRPSWPLRCTAQIRYRHTAAPATVVPAEEGDLLTVRFDEPQRAITAGQAVVFYDDDRVLGGAWIHKACRRRGKNGY